MAVKLENIFVTEKVLRSKIRISDMCCTWFCPRLRMTHHSGRQPSLTLGFTRPRPASCGAAVSGRVLWRIRMEKESGGTYLWKIEALYSWF